MRALVGVLVAACFYYSGLVKLARWRRQHSKPCLIILNYHRASGGDLRRHLFYLSRHYRMLHLEEALEELFASPEERKRGHDRRTPLVLTFDDGYYDSYTHGFALARELRVPITIFLIPGYIESGNRFWWLEGDYLAQHAQVKEVVMEERTYHLDKLGERQALAQAIDTRLRHATSVAEREAFLEKARKLVAVAVPDEVEPEATRPLTWAHVREMQESGWVFIGAHTMHHPILAYLSCPEEVKKEVGECRSLLQQRLGSVVRTFAYPVGRPEHIGEVAIEAVREAGYNWAVTTTHGITTPQNDPYQLQRLLGDVSRHWLVMAAETSGVWHFFSPLWKWKRARDVRSAQFRTG
jgi:peptidoglycan/xylan/chitin deacetylase (PgdA/CDA1 family)